jgi:chaperonin GroES
LPKKIIVTPKAKKSKKITFETILATDNLATVLDEIQTSRVTSQVMERYNTDLQSRSQKQYQLKEIIKLVLATNEKRSFPFEGASNVIFPLIATACTEFGAKCYPEIFKDGYIVKAKVIGNDDGQIMKDPEGNEMVDENGNPAILDGTNLLAIENQGAKLKRGERVATVINYQLNEEMENYEPDMDALFHALPAIGTLFKKVYYHPETKSPCSELVYPDKLIINDFASCLEKTPITHIIEKYPQDVIMMIRRGDYVDFNFDPESMDSTTAQGGLDDTDDQKNGDSAQAGLYQFLEQHCWLDLDEDHFLEPYIATIHQASGTLVSLVKRFDEIDVVRNKKGELQEIKSQNFFVKYIFLPSPDGSFYGIGLGHLLFNINSSVNSSINQLIDAGTLQNTGGGFIGKNLKMAGGMKPFRLAEWKMVDSFGGNIRDSIVPLPAPDPSQTLFTLLSYLVESGKALGSFRDVLSGEGAANMAATTYMGMAENNMKQFKSVFKRIYSSMKQEFKKIYQINGEYLDQKKYAEILDMTLMEVPNVKEDFSKGGYDIVPVADVETINSAQKYAKAQFLMSFVGSPNVDQVLNLKKIFEITGIPDIDKLVIPAPQMSNPLLEIEQLKQQGVMQKLQAEQQLKIAEMTASNELLKAQISKIEAETNAVQTQSMVNLATAGKIAKDTELAESKEQLDVLDNQIDAMAKQQEIKDRQAEREFQTKMKSAEFLHDAMKENEYIKIEHRKLNQKEQQAQSQQSKKIKGDV